MRIPRAFCQTWNLRRPGSRSRIYVAACLALGVCSLSFALVGCGKNTSVSTPAAPALATASFSPGGGGGMSSLTIPLSRAKQITSLPDQSLGFGPTCTLHAGSAPMVFTAGSSSTWFGVSPQAGNLQPYGTTSIGISTIIWNNVVTGGVNNGFVIVSAPGYNQLTGFTFYIRAANGSPGQGPYVTIGTTCP